MGPRSRMLLVQYILGERGVLPEHIGQNAGAHLLMRQDLALSPYLVQTETLTWIKALVIIT